MKNANIAVLGGTDDAAKEAVVSSAAPQMRLGNVVAACLPALLTLACIVIDFGTGKIAVLDDAHKTGIAAAVEGATGNDTTVEFTASGDTKAKVWLASGASYTAPVVAGPSDLPTLDDALASIGTQPTLTLSSAISRIEDAMANADVPTPCILVVKQDDAGGSVSVTTFDTSGHATAAYVAAKAVAGAVLAAEFQGTEPVTAADVPQFFE